MMVPKVMCGRGVVVVGGGGQQFLKETRMRNWNFQSDAKFGLNQEFKNSPSQGRYGY